MGKGTGEAKSGTIEMVLLKPVETAGLSDDQINDLIVDVRSSIAKELGLGNEVVS
jgi:hypothetical protein